MHYQIEDSNGNIDTRGNLIEAVSRACVIIANHDDMNLLTTVNFTCDTLKHIIRMKVDPGTTFPDALLVSNNSTPVIIRKAG